MWDIKGIACAFWIALMYVSMQYQLYIIVGDINHFAHLHHKLMIRKWRSLDTINLVRNASIILIKR